MIKQQSQSAYDLQKSIEIGNTIISNGLINLATRGRLKLDTILKYEYVDKERINGQIPRYRE